MKTGNNDFYRMSEVLIKLEVYYKQWEIQKMNEKSGKQ